MRKLLNTIVFMAMATAPGLAQDNNANNNANANANSGNDDATDSNINANNVTSQSENNAANSGNFNADANNDADAIEQAVEDNPAANGGIPINNTAPPPLNNAAPPPLNNAAPPVNNVAPTAPTPIVEAPAAAAPAFDGKLDLRFQFDQRGLPGIHTFVLHWAAADSNLQSIDILVTETQELLQKIIVPQDKVHLVIRDLMEKKDHIKDRIVEGVDYNFDRFGDLRLTARWPYKVGGKQYLVWLYDEHQNRYVLSDAISALPNPQPIPKSRRIQAIELGGHAGFEYERRLYSINKGGKLRIQALISQKIRDAKSNAYLRDVRVRINGDMQRICKIYVPAEGNPKRLWGGKDVCAKYLTKDPPQELKSEDVIRTKAWR